MLQHTKKWESAIPFIIILLVALLFFWRFLLGKYIIWNYVDIQYLFYPVRKLIEESYRQGHIPYWFNIIGSGFPVFSLLQFSVLYPINILNALLFSFPYSLNTYVIIHFIIAGWGTILFAKALKLNQFAQTICGISFAFSGFMFAHAPHIDMIAMMAWLPWTLYLLELRYCSGRRIYLLVLSVLLGITLLIGHPQMWIMTVFVAYLYTIIRTALLENSRGKVIQKSLIAIVELSGGVILALLIAGIQWVPSLEAYSLSSRNILKNDPTFANNFHIYLSSLIQLIFPKFYGQDIAGELVNGNFWGPPTYQEGIFYIGLPMMILASMLPFYYLRIPKNKSRILILIIIAIITGVLSLGDNGLLYQFWKSLPFLNAIRVPARFMIITMFALIMMAGISLDNLSKLIKENNLDLAKTIYKKGFKRFLLLCLFAIAAALSFVLIVYSFGYVALSTITSSLVYGFIIGFFSFGLLWLWIQRRITQRLFKIGFTLILVADLFFIFGSYLRFMPQQEPQAAHPYQEIINNLQNQRLISVPTDLFFEPDKISLNYLVGNLPAAYQVPSQNWYAQLMSNEHEILGLYIKQSLLKPEYNLSLQALNMSVITHVQSNQPLKFNALKLIRQDKDLYLYQNTQAHTRVYWANSYKNIILNQDLKNQIVNIFIRAVNLKDQILLFQKDVQELPAETLLSQGHANKTKVNPQIIRYDNEAITINYQSQSPGFIAIAQTYDPGWKAFVDGQETKVLQANIAFQAVSAPAGSHSVELVYKPWGIEIGYILTGMGIVTTIALVSIWYFQNRNKRLHWPKLRKPKD